MLDTNDLRYCVEHYPNMTTEDVAIYMGISIENASKLRAYCGIEYKKLNKKLYCDITERELEVLSYLAKGASNKEIAETLIISLDTVRTHIHSIYSKLGLSSDKSQRGESSIRVKAVLWYLKNIK